MTGIKKLRDICRALKGSPWCGTDIATIGGEPAYEKLSKIADQIERETLPRPRFEDGKTVRRGDLVLTNRGTAKVASFSVIDDGESWLDLGVLGSGERICKRLDPGERVKRPEPPDTWERVEKDADKGACEYFDHDAKPCETCRGDDLELDCSLMKCRELVRRCKKLAGVD